MAESTKYMPVNGGTVVSDFKFTKIFSFRTKRTRAFAYVFIAVFVALTVFLAFNPSPNPSSPWFSNIFAASTFSRSTSVQANGITNSSSDSIRSQFSSIYSYFFTSNSSISTNNSTVSDFNSSISTQNNTVSVSSLNNSSVSVSGSPIVNNKPPTEINHDLPIAPNQTRSAGGVGEKVEALKSNQTSFNSSTSQSASNQTIQSSLPIKNDTENGKKSSSDTQKSETKSEPKSNSSSGSNETTLTSVTVKNGTKSSSDTKKSEPKSTSSSGNNQGIGNLVKNLLNCNLFDGEWVRDESYPLYKPGSCSLIDEQFNCFTNGRPDKEFQMLKWKPKACTLPRLDGNQMLQMLRGKRLVFVGDSLNRNMWESLICILKNSVKDQSKVYEASGRHHFRSEPSYSFIFKDYNCTIEFFVAPFIVREFETKDKNGEKKETLRLDLVGSSADQYKNADIVVFNTGHWWTHEKTAKGKDYYQEGSYVYNELNVLEAFRKAMTTWGRWVDANINPSKTLVFFRGYSASHFRGGQWNSGGQCDNEVEPIKNTTYLSPYPDKMKVLEKILKGMKTKVSYLNITRLTDFRKDGHPSIYRKRHYSEEERRSPLHFQDCSHWCLPGVPDSWNEILYAQLLVNHNKNVIS